MLANDTLDGQSGVSNMVNQTPSEIAESLRRLMNRQGHGFQYAVARRINELSREGNTYWRISAIEFPVVTNEVETHIDIILQSRTRRCYLVLECKRVNPARAYWAFMKAYPEIEEARRQVVFDQLTFFGSGGAARRDIVCGTPSFPTYDLTCGLATDKKGDEASKDPKSDMNDAVTQVLRGTSGLIRHLADRPKQVGDDGNRPMCPVFVPTIVTTALIWGVDGNVGSAELLTGELGQQPAATSHEFLWYFYNRSRSLISPVQASNPGININEWLNRESTRSIAVVTASGLDDFLRRDLEQWLL